MVLVRPRIEALVLTFEAKRPVRIDVALSTSARSSKMASTPSRPHLLDRVELSYPYRGSMVRGLCRVTPIAPLTVSPSAMMAKAMGGIDGRPEWTSG